MAASADSWASSEATRHSMQGNRSRDTKPELAVRRILHADGFRYRVNCRPLPALRRTADIVFTRARIAVFIDGCFWHGCPQHYSRPATHSEYWDPKVVRNRERDVDTDTRLIEAGWVVIWRWEHEDAASVAAAIEEARRAAVWSPGSPIGLSRAAIPPR